MLKKLKITWSLFCTALSWTALCLLGTLVVKVATILGSGGPLTINWNPPRKAVEASETPTAPPATQSTIEGLQESAGKAMSWCWQLLWENWVFWIALLLLSLLLGLIVERYKKNN